MFKKVDRKSNRVARHQRIRKSVNGTSERPRMNVFRSTNNIYVQFIDDEKRITLAAASTLDKEIKDAVSHTGNVEAAKKVGELAAKRAIEKGIKAVVFDRGGYIYHGRIQAVADGAREAGLEF
ncbi:MAG: 50S ribosomal protein L18 [Filifactoraceae bacterium]